jgi:acyl-CoA synthetase (AMP-forming)/AMP-acid ligase II
MPDPATIPAVLAHAAMTWPSAVAIQTPDVRWTFAQLQHRARRAAAGLQALGVGRGDRVAIWAPNVPDWVVAALGIQLAGAALVPINTRYKGAEARDVIVRSGAKVVFTTGPFLGLDFQAMLHPMDRPVVVFGDPFEGFLRDDWSEVDVSPDDLSDVLFTSGTTGRSKGVMTTHGQTVQTFTTWVQVVGLTAGDRYLIVNPFFHAFGYKAGWLACLIAGATALPMPTFDVDAVLEQVSRDRVTVLPGAPTLYTSLLMKDRSGADLSSLRLAVTGAASIPVSLVHRMRDELGFRTVLTAYGLTESTGVATMCRADDDAETIATTSGRAIPGVELKVVDASGAELPPGEAGEVWVRGYNVMKGYLDDPEATAATVVDGWLRTGDIGVLDERGNLKITDRLKDMFIVGGFNAYPAEIESALLEHPAVGEVAVIGVPDERMGEVGMAFVLRKAPLEEAELIAWARERLANFKVPRQVAFVDALPRNPSGKVLKLELRRLAAAS